MKNITLTQLENLLNSLIEEEQEQIKGGVVIEEIIIL